MSQSRNKWSRPPRIWILLVAITVLTAITIVSPLLGEEIVGFIVLVAVIYLAAGISTRCPRCGRYFGRREGVKELINSQETFRTVIRKVQHHNPDGTLSGYTTYPEQIRFVRETFLRNFSCKFCQHTWVRQFSSEHEG